MRAAMVVDAKQSYAMFRDGNDNYAGFESKREIWAHDRAFNTSAMT
jgi:hypothetical protein